MSSLYPTGTQSANRQPEAQAMRGIAEVVKATINGHVIRICQCHWYKYLKTRNKKGSDPIYVNPAVEPSDEHVELEESGSLMRFAGKNRPCSAPNWRFHINWVRTIKSPLFNAPVRQRHSKRVAKCDHMAGQTIYSQEKSSAESRVFNLVCRRLD